jgi:hypothetical protein
MSSLIVLPTDADWQASNGLFDFVLEFLAGRVSDPAAAERMRAIVDNHFQGLWLNEFGAATQQEIRRLIREELVPAGERQLAEAPGREDALARLRELAELVT